MIDGKAGDKKQGTQKPNISCKECDGDINLIRNNWCLKCPKSR